MSGTLRKIAVSGNVAFSTKNHKSRISKALKIQASAGEEKGTGPFILKSKRQSEKWNKWTCPLFFSGSTPVSQLEQFLPDVWKRADATTQARTTESP